MIGERIARQQSNNITIVGVGSSNNITNYFVTMKTQNTIKVLFIGDIVGRPGRQAVKKYLAQNKAKYDFVIANGENLSGGCGMTVDKYEEMLDAGVDYFTSGNHIWNNADFVPYLDHKSTRVVRPANYPASAPGRGYAETKINNTHIVIANLQGRVFMPDEIEDPFVAGKNIADKFSDSIIIVDFHAEATSEKIALGYYLDGKASAVLGTHTHVQTADEKILKNGTAYISDVGMCGPYESVIGVKKDIIIEKFLTQLPQSHKVASGETFFNAVVVVIDPATGKALEIKRIIENNPLD